MLDSTILLGTAATIGLFHTLVGVDHTLPFIVLARSERWSLRKLWWVTGLCGVAHILSSVVIGTIGIGLGVALERLTLIESARGSFAARLLIGLGLAYMVWGLVKGRRAHRHSHLHHHEDGTVHVHDHDHAREHLHPHRDRGRRLKAISVFGLFVVFVLGPCEALIPMLMAPAASGSYGLVAAVIGVFGAATLVTMLVVVTVGWFGMQWRGFNALERHLHALAGFAIAMSGLAIELLGV
ncbi:MAG: sulfite exporter TauE/SafE family protein [Myxococcales bacterium]|nr:sulfite exporter TauE/SafE family protein [Myxococcales bacterium]